MSSSNWDNLTKFLHILVHYTSFSCQYTVVKTINTMPSGERETEYSCCSPHIKEKVYYPFNITCLQSFSMSPLF